MGYTGDFDSKNACLRHFLNTLKNDLEINKHKAKITVYTHQDILLTITKDNKEEYSYFCLLYYYDRKSDSWRYKDMDHTVGPCPQDPVPTELLRKFIINPSFADSEFSKEFIDEVKKKLHHCKTASVKL